MVFSGLVVNRGVPDYSVSLCKDHFTTDGKEVNETGSPEWAVRCGVGCIWRFFPLHPLIQSSLFGKLCFIVPRNCFEVSF